MEHKRHKTDTKDTKPGIWTCCLVALCLLCSFPGFASAQTPTPDWFGYYSLAEGADLAGFQPVKPLTELLKTPASCANRPASLVERKMETSRELRRCEFEGSFDSMQTFIRVIRGLFPLSSDRSGFESMRNAG